MKIYTLGGCCKKSSLNHENTVAAAKKLGVDAPINIKDQEEIMAYGVMSTPGLVIDGKVVSTGRLLTIEQAEELIIKNK